MGLTDLYYNPYQQTGLGLAGQGQAAPPPPPPQGGVSLLGGGGNDAQALARAQSAAQSQQQAPPPSQWLQNAGAALNSKVGTVQTQPQAQPDGPPQLYGVGGNAAGGASAAPSVSTLNLPTAQMLTTKPHDVQTGTDLAVQGLGRVGAEQRSALDEQKQADLELNEAGAQEKAGEAGRVRGAQMEREKSDAETDKKTEAAHATWMKAGDVDPDHYMSSMSTGKRMMLTIAAGLMQGGMALRGQSGANPILEQIQKETERDVDAQKSAINKKHSLYDAALKSGLDEKQAHAVTEKAYLQAGKLSGDSFIQSAESPMLAAAWDAKKGALDEKILDATARQYGRVQGGTASVGGIPKEVRDLSAKLQENSKGTLTPEESLARAAKSLGYNYGGTAGASWEKAGLAGGPGRSAAVQMEYQQNNDRLKNAEEMATELHQMISGGGKLDPTRTARGKELVGLLQPELAYALAGKPPNNEDQHHAASLLPTDPNAYQFTGADKARMDEVLKIIRTRRAQVKANGPQVAGGRGFEAPTQLDEAAAAAGAKED